MKKHVQYSKIITSAASLVMLPVAVYVVWKCLEIAELAVSQGFMGALPYVTAIVGFTEATVTLILQAYHSNSKAEKKYASKNVTVSAQDEVPVQGAEDTQGYAAHEEDVQKPMQSVNLNIDF